MTTPAVGPCPADCTLAEGHGWERVDADGTAERHHVFFRSPSGYIVCQQAETWSPLICDAVLSDPFVFLTDDLAGELTTVGAGALARAAAQAARVCRVAEKRWAV